MSHVDFPPKDSNMKGNKNLINCVAMNRYCWQLVILVNSFNEMLLSRITEISTINITIQPIALKYVILNILYLKMR